MRVVEKGHVYKLRNKVTSVGPSTEPDQTIIFVNQQPGQEHAGCTTQEVLRALIDRTRHCANCMPHPNNARIVYHLQMALLLHETRALERRLEKGEIRPEYLPTVGGSHLLLPDEVVSEGQVTEELLPHPLDGAKVPNHSKKERV